MIPYQFNGPYADCYSVEGMSMDARHVYLIHQILSSGLFRNVLEVGCFNGASSTAFIEASNADPDLNVTLCDPCLTASLRSVVVSAKHPARVHYRYACSTSVMASSREFDLVLLDGGHDIHSALADLQHVTRMLPRVVIAHDTNSTDCGGEMTDGAKIIKVVLSNLTPYSYCREDCEQRDGEWTDRGLFVACLDAEAAEVVEAAFATWCDAPVLIETA